MPPCVAMCVCVCRFNDLTFGKSLGAGAFGTVRQATALLDGVTSNVAVKTLAFTESDDFEEKLEEFTQEATVGWAVSSRARNGVRARIHRSSRATRARLVFANESLTTSVLPFRPPQKESRICATLGVAHDVSKTCVNLHLVLEHVDCDGDLHDTIHSSDNWECLRSGGEDTGARLKSRYATTDADDDAWAFILPRSQKLTVAEDLARCAPCATAVQPPLLPPVVPSCMNELHALDGTVDWTVDWAPSTVHAYLYRWSCAWIIIVLCRALHELRAADVVHCDIKPSNMLLARVAPNIASSKTGSKRGKKQACRVENQLKLIDFGEANETFKADRVEVGTPGYMAPEVMTDGDCTSSSDVYSAGVALVEVWNGGLWSGAETRGEGSEGMRREILNVSRCPLSI